MKRSILRILSLVLVIAMVFSLPAFAATAYRLKITIIGNTYDEDLNPNGTGKVATTWAQSPRFGGSTSFLEALAQVFSLTYDGNYTDADGRRIGSVDDVFTRSSLHQTVIEGLSKRNNETEWKEFIDKTIAASYETNTTTVDVDKEVLKEAKTLSISKAYDDAEKDHTITFTLTRSQGEQWEYWANLSEKNEYDDVYTIIAEIETVTTGGGGSTTPTTPTGPTIPVSGEKTVPVDVEVNDGTATIPDITDSQIEQANATQDSGIVVDASGIDVDTVELGEDAMENIKESGNDLEIRLPNGTLTIPGEDLGGTTGSTSYGLKEYDDPTEVDDDNNGVDLDEIDKKTLEDSGATEIFVFNGTTGANLGRPDDGNAYFIYDPETKTFERVDNNNIPVEDGTIIISRPIDYSGAIAGGLITDDHNLYLKGYPDGSVQPLGNITRAEVAMAFYRLLKNKDITITASYSDVKADAWYAEAVNALSSIGIIQGYVDGTFKPDQAITRAEFTAVATRFLDGKGGNVKFKDVADDFWAKDNISTAAFFGWINGYEDATFRPNAKITRAEAATIINHMLGRRADKDYVNANFSSMKQFTDLKDKTIWYFYDMVEATNSHDFTVVDSKEATWTHLR